MIKDLLITVLTPVVTVSTYYCTFWVNRERIGITTKIKALVFAFAIALLSSFCTQLFAAIENLLTGDTYKVRYHGILLLQPLVVLIAARLLKLNRGALFDSIALTNITMMIPNRITCLLAGCDYGRYIFGTSWRWPVREAEIVFAIILLSIFIRFFIKEKHQGELFPLFLIIYGVFRFFLEGFSHVESYVLGIHVTHLWSIVTFIVGCSIYFEMRAQKAAKAEHRRS